LLVIRWVLKHGYVAASETLASASEIKVIKLALTQSLGCSAKWDTHYKLPRRSRQVHSTLIVTSNSKYIAALKAQFLGENLPVISIDTKKKELIGNYRREGKIWRRQPLEVESYFASYAQCVAVPFGIYDLAKNVGYVTVGISHNTAEFAVNCLVHWWKVHGRTAYAHADRVLILADGGGGNGYNLRTWKKDLQDKLCDAFGLTVTLSHYPTGCSKWNPVEYRLFSHISMNWAGQPLRNLDVMLAFIRGTTTTTGLKVEAYLDQGIYRKGRKVTERQLKELALSAHDICPRWNYSLSSRPPG